MNRLKRNAVKEAFDRLPSGVCFFDKNGFVVLCNYQMHRLIYSLSGRDLQSLSELQDLLNSDLPTAGPRKDIFLLNDGSAWRFSQESVVTKDETTYTQITAADITTLYLRQKELEENNLRLEDYARRMRRLSANMIALTREEEILKMKMHVHNDIGRSMIATRKFLQQNRPMEELDLTVWKNAVRLLKNDYECSEDKEPLDKLFLAARNLNIKIILEGQLPEDTNAAELLVAVLWDCMTNAVRHAGATELYGRLSGDGHLAIMTVTNNGAVPDRTIVEGGGLSSLRIRIRKSSGTMSIRSTPRFELTVSVPVRAKSNCIPSSGGLGGLRN